MIDDIYDVIFYGMNIPKVVEKYVNRTKNANRDNMTESEFIAYELGIENTISTIKQILDNSMDSESIVFYNPDVEGIEEFIECDLVDWLKARGLWLGG